MPDKIINIHVGVESGRVQCKYQLGDKYVKILWFHINTQNNLLGIPIPHSIDMYVEHDHKLLVQNFPLDPSILKNIDIGTFMKHWIMD
jgi:hypothetical protein